MQKITYENYSNGLSASFSRDSPRSFLAEFDGNSVGSTAVTYKPAEFDGERFISANLNARTVTFTAEWYGVRKGRYSIEESYKMWERIQRVFVTGDMGKLTWTNGVQTRFIECRTSELPNFTRVIGCKLSAEFKLVADYPYWQDVNEQFVDLSGYNVSNDIYITNSCGIAVPFVFVCVGSSPLLGNLTTGEGLSLDLPDGSNAHVEIDTRRCTVKSDGVICNEYLYPNSSFFKLAPGTNRLKIGYFSNTSESFIKWRDHYLGVNC